MYRTTAKVKGEKEQTIRNYRTRKEAIDDWREMIKPNCKIEIIDTETKKVWLTFDNYKGDF